MKEVFGQYAEILTTIAYLLPDGVKRVMDEEAYTINMSVLGNRRTCTQLCQHLVTSESTTSMNTFVVI